MANNCIGSLCPNADALLSRFRGSTPFQAKLKSQGISVLNDATPTSDPTQVVQPDTPDTIPAGADGGNSIGTFGFTAEQRQNDLAFFSKIQQESTKLGIPSVRYKCIRVADTHVDPIFGDAASTVYDPPVMVNVNYMPANIVLELLSFGLGAVNDDLNCIVNSSHFLSATNRKYPQVGDKFLDSRGKTYKLTSVIKDYDNVFFGDPLSYAFIARQTEEEF